MKSHFGYSFWFTVTLIGTLGVIGSGVAEFIAKQSIFIYFVIGFSLVLAVGSVGLSSKIKENNQKNRPKG